MSRKITKHINIWVFFTTNRVKNGEMSLFWYPTGNMIGDYMTKPLQVDMFRKLRDKIMEVIPAVYPGPGNIKV